MHIPTIKPPARGVLPSAMGFNNSVFVGPNDDLITKYNWLKSSDRNGRMGALSVTNRRTLILCPGTYALVDKWELDTDYVDVVGLSSNPKDTIVTRSSGATAEQTADDVTLIGFTIKNAGNYIAFVLNATDNSDSYYRFMHFRQPNPTEGKESIWSTGNIAGLWEFCEADGWAWIINANKELNATMIHCTAGEHSFNGGIGESGDLSGTFVHCKAGDYSFGGGVTLGVEVSGTLIDCEAGDNSYAMGTEFSGKTYRCKGGDNCFAGYCGDGTSVGNFSGYAEDCVASDRSFGSGGEYQGYYPRCSGELVRCKCTDMPESMICEGAKITDSYLQVTGTNESCLTLKDSNTIVYGSTLIASGTGNSFAPYDVSVNVLVLHCRVNKDKYPDAVTNLVGDGSLAAGYCIIDSDVA